MKSVLITTTHTAPYIDLWINSLKQDFKVSVFYTYRVSKEKKWANYANREGYESSELSFGEKLKICKKHDFVLLGGWKNMVNILLCFMLIPYKNKVAFFCDYPIEGKTKINFIMKLIKKIIMNAADYIFPASESMKNYLYCTYGISKKKIKVFPYAHSQFVLDIHQINKKRIEQIQLGKPIILFIANNFLERKGFNIIAEALKLLSIQDIDQMKIRIAGTGERMDYYKQYLSEFSNYIDFLDWIENEQYENEMSNCDVYLHASIFEPFGIPPLDAMQRGKFIIVSDGVKSMSHFEKTHNKRILFYNAEDYFTLANILKQVINNKKNLYSNYEKTIDLVDKSYSIENNINAIKSILYK
jgi:glycosyltransferase involved in cell wall biosynthesis